MMGMSYKI